MFIKLFAPLGTIPHVDAHVPTVAFYAQGCVFLEDARLLIYERDFWNEEDDLRNSQNKGDAENVRK